MPQTTLAAPADRRFRRAHVKPQRSHGRTVRARVVLTLLVLAIGYGVYKTVVITTRPLFQINRIIVRGNGRLSTGEVMTLLDGLRGRHLLAVHLAEWRQRLLKSAWVEDAVMRRLLPSTIDIMIKERRPLGISRIARDLFLIDSRGNVIDEYGPAYADLDLPIIRGLTAVPTGNDVAINQQRVHLATRVLSALSRQDIAGRLSELDVADPRNAGVILKGDPAVIKLGDQNFLERLQTYLELSSAVRDRIPDPDYVDLRFDRRIYVRPLRRSSAEAVWRAKNGTW